jgi:hypothetical protein
VVILAAVFGLGHGGTIAVEYVLLTGAVPPTVVGGVTGVASAIDGISGAVASAVTTGLLAVGLVRAHGMSLPSAADYSRAWLVGAAVAAAGALAVAVSAVRQAPRPPTHSSQKVEVNNKGRRSVWKSGSRCTQDGQARWSSPS